MKRKKLNILSCERARAFSIEKALAKLGHFPIKSTEKEAWFLSPFRSETQASFKVSKKLNRWYDHGEGIGGNIIDLVCQITTCTVKEALNLIEKDQASFSFQQQQIFSKEYESEHKITVTKVKPLTHFALKEYSISRKIPIRIAKKLLKEVHYYFKGKRYFALGLKNNSGGWELRNKYVKNSSSPKDVTHIRNRHSKLIVTEGMFDLLSILEITKNLENENDFLILNSTAFLQKTEKIIEEYDHIDLYLDNDFNGRQATQNLIEHSKNCRDKSNIYKGFKDMNEWLINRVKDLIGQGIQDVSLLPQKQPCFTPDGRKVKKK